MKKARTSSKFDKSALPSENAQKIDLVNFGGGGGGGLKLVVVN